MRLPFIAKYLIAAMSAIAAEKMNLVMHVDSHLNTSRVRALFLTEVLNPILLTWPFDLLKKALRRTDF